MKARLMKNGFFLCAAVAVGMMTYVMSPGNSVVYKAADALFVLGMLMILSGFLRFIRKLGFGGIFVYSWGRMHHVIRSEKYGKVRAYPDSYFEYLSTTKQKPQYVSGLLVLGFGFVMISFILSYAAQGII